MAALRRLLRAKEGMAAGDLAIELNVHPSSVAIHLNMLARAGLIVSAKQEKLPSIQQALKR
jgi:Mn-dependent DtxR family transcriptional regulator